MGITGIGMYNENTVVQDNIKPKGMWMKKKK